MLGCSDGELYLVTMDAGSGVDGEIRQDGGPDSAPSPDGPRPDVSPLADSSASPDGPLPTTSFTVVLMPDTQYYAQQSALFKHFTAQTSWIVSNRASERIMFVSHVGDIVHNNASGATKNKEQWDHEQGLIRFDKIIGGAAGQVPPGTKINKAILTLTTEGSYADSKGGARFHRMKVGWSEASSWSSLKGGVTPGAEAETTFDADSAGKVSSKGTRSFDVTASVRAWVNGAANHGWVLINKSTDRWQFRSSEWAEVVERPLLTVVY